jgi:hypothetical protein
MVALNACMMISPFWIARVSLVRVFPSPHREKFRSSRGAWWWPFSTSGISINHFSWLALPMVLEALLP